MNKDIDKIIKDIEYKINEEYSAAKRKYDKTRDSYWEGFMDGIDIIEQVINKVINEN